jgi:hypothetical protein
MILRCAGFLRDAITSPFVTQYSLLSGGVGINLHKGHVIYVTLFQLVYHEYRSIFSLQ